MAELVENGSTNQQREPGAKFKTVVSANSAGRRSSRSGVSSSNLKIKTP